MEKTAVVSLIAILVAATFLFQMSVNSPTDQAYKNWKEEFAMHFTPDQQSLRKIAFMRTLNEINQHNSNPHHTYSKGLNQFSHLSKEQFSAMFLNHYHSKELQKAKIQQIHSHKDYAGVFQVGDVDWQTLGKVSAVKTQGSCDAGYAFSTVSLTQSSFLFQNVPVVLSEQQIIDCSANYTTFGCQGGSRSGSLQYVIEKGLNLMSSYPYRGQKGSCMKSTGDYKLKGSLTTFNGCDDIKSGLYASPLTVAVNALDWMTYKAGIFNGCTSTEVNHDIFLAGVTLTYWRLKNSWGIRWGEYGYIRLNIGNTCGICEKPAFGFK